MIKPRQVCQGSSHFMRHGAERAILVDALSSTALILPALSSSPEPRFRQTEWNFPVWELFASWFDNQEAHMGRGILLWLIGVPIPVIIILFLLFGR
jgi:hypothetical protein